MFCIMIDAGQVLSFILHLPQPMSLSHRSRSQILTFYVKVLRYSSKCLFSLVKFCVKVFKVLHRSNLLFTLK